MKTRDEMRTVLIRGGVNSLGTFGYPGVRPENILTDRVYSAFFKTMLEDNLREVEGKNPTLDKVIRDLIAECAGLDG